MMQGKRSTPKQIVHCFLGINGHVATVPLQERKVNAKNHFIAKVFSEIGKNKEEQTEHSSPRQCKLTHTNNGFFYRPKHRILVISRIILIRHQFNPFTSLCFHISKINDVVNDFRRQKKLLNCPKPMFWS